MIKALITLARLLKVSNFDWRYAYYLVAEGVLQGSFLSGGYVPFSEVSNQESVLEWLETTLLPSIYNEVWYNGSPYADNELLYIANFNR